MAITLRSTKGSALTHNELDGNFTDLDGRMVTQESVLTNPQCRLDYTNTTTITLNPKNGNKVPIYTGSAWVYRTLTTATASNAALGNFATRYVYAYWTGAAIALELSTTAYTTQDGMPVKTGDATRLLVGLIATNGSGVFADSITERLTASYWNRRKASLHAVTGVTAQSTTDTWQNINSTLVRFVVFTNDCVQMSMMADVYSPTTTSTCYAGLGVDSQSTPTIYLGSSVTAANYYEAITTTYAYSATEGLHYAACLGYAQTVGITWNSMYVNGETLI